MMLDPRSIMVAMPCGDGRVMAETMGMLISSRNRFAGISIKSECSIVQLARNEIAATFLASPYEWLVCIDSDIVPAPSDFDLLLQPTDPDAVYWRANVDDPAASMPPDAMPQPARVLTALVARAPAGQPVNLDQKVKAAADMLVCSEYAYKNDTLEPVKLGFGFVRIHRIVFEKLQELRHPVNPDSEQYDAILTIIREAALLTPDAFAVLERSRPEPGGGPRLWQGSRQGRLFHDYFPCGPQISNLMPNAQWKGEDHGFFMLCHMAGIYPRIETRTRLVHIGRKAYQYQGPQYGGGQ